MEDSKTVTIPKRTAICAARICCYMHEGSCQSYKYGKPFDCDWVWGMACYECREADECRGRWYDTLRPLFEAANMYPRVARYEKTP